MKSAMKKAIGDENGKILILVLILLVVGGLVLAPLLGLMSTGLAAGQTYEKKASELYAADAGVEDAIWKIQNKSLEWVGDDSEPDPLTVNGKTATVTILRQRIGESGPCHVEYRYHILSTADGEDRSATTVNAVISVLYNLPPDFSGLLDHVIVSQDDYTLQGPTNVDPPEGEDHGPVRYYDGPWPTRTQLSEWYSQDVKDAVPYTSNILDVESYTDTGIPALYRDGTLSVVNKGSADLTVRLEGTMYITDDTWIAQTDKDFVLDLNGNTIFVESDTGDGQYALWIGGKCTLTGSGVIVAVGDIWFKPNLDCSPDDYVLVLSVEGKTYMQPNGDFYGTLAGTSDVYIQNGDATWTDPEGRELNFPMGESAVVDEPALPISELTIMSWQIEQGGQ